MARGGPSSATAAAISAWPSPAGGWCASPGVRSRSIPTKSRVRSRGCWSDSGGGWSAARTASAAPAPALRLRLVAELEPGGAQHDPEPPDDQHEHDQRDDLGAQAAWTSSVVGSSLLNILRRLGRT